MHKHCPLKIIQALMQALAHKIRTPLSVISNDLSYFQTLIEPTECERGIQKCRQISEFFKPVQLLQSSDDRSEVFTLGPILRQVFAGLLECTGTEFELQGSSANLQQTFKWLAELFEIKSIEMKCTELYCSINIELLKALRASDTTGLNSDLAQDSLISEIYAIKASDDSILPMLIDAVFISFMAQSRLLDDRKIEIVFKKAQA